MCAGIILLSLRHVALGVLHKHRLGFLIAEAIGLAVDHGVDRAIRLYVLVKGQTFRAHVVELTGCRHGRCRQTKHQSACKGGCDVTSNHRFSPWGLGGFAPTFYSTLGAAISVTLVT